MNYFSKKKVKIMKQSERDIDIYVAQILDQTNLPQEMVKLMKRVIELNPDLSADERNLLSVAYKNAINQPRKGIRSLDVTIDQEQREGTNNESRISSLRDIRTKMFQELSATCNDVEELIDSQLLPASSSAEARVFYHKMKADYLRYVCEFMEDGDDKAEAAEKTKECYEEAINIAKNDIPPYKPSYLGLLLNYSVFLYEIMDNKEEAIELSKKTHAESIQLLDENSENSYQEANMILQLLHDNTVLWTQ